MNTIHRLLPVLVSGVVAIASLGVAGTAFAAQNSAGCNNFSIHAIPSGTYAGRRTDALFRIDRQRAEEMSMAANSSTEQTPAARETYTRSDVPYTGRRPDETK